VTTPLELLSPAGNADIGIAAIDHGADAVYIGAPRFSARADAATALADISRLIHYAHLYYARVYVALNTILSDMELPDAVEIINEVFHLGADGLIIQDVGLLELDLPPIPLIASTQMHNDTVEKVQFLEAVGFQRVILARELSLNEISAIRKKTKIELEAFVHGALCVSYSGQCYMSQAAAGRSGNRGVCAQPCRSRYTLTDAEGNIIHKEKFLLSLKDLNRMNAIPELVASGVTSFKIEGRYKGIDYVKNVTAAYRQAIDRFIEDHPRYRRSSSGFSTFTFSPDPDRTFNRGYTSYFLSNPGREKAGSIHTQKSIGQYIGKATSLGRDFFQTDSRELHNGDGLCFFTADNELAGFRVDRVDKDKAYPNAMKNLHIGASLYRNHDAAFARILNKTSAKRQITVEMDFTQEETGARLSTRDEDDNEVEATIEFQFQPPKDPSRAKQQIEKQLTSTGNTPYLVTKLNIYPEQPGFFPVGMLNKLRRDALDLLTRIRLEKRPRRIARFVPNVSPYPYKSLDFRANVLNEQARRFYERHGVESIEPAFETLSDMTGKTVMTTRYCVRHQLDLCPKSSRKGKAPKEPLRISDSNHTYRLEFDCQKCRMLVILEK
jgi:putative protease